MAESKALASTTGCSSCAKNAATVNTMLAVMQQQAATLKEQQNTIANLISMLTSGSSASASKAMMKHSESPEDQLPTMAPNRGFGLQSTPQNSAKSRRKPVASARNLTTTTVKVSSQAKAPAAVQKTAPKGAAKRKAPPQQAEEYRALPADDGESSGNFGVKMEYGNDESGNGSPKPFEGDGEDGMTITKIWMQGTFQEKSPCPLPECADRKFSAADMYYMRRHFQQCHRLTHPNPIFVLQCPVEDCGVEYEQSLRDLRKHMAKDHPELFVRAPPKPSGKHGASHVKVEDVEDEGAEMGTDQGEKLDNEAVDGEEPMEADQEAAE